jgi:hypothetical protein
MRTSPRNLLRKFRPFLKGRVKDEIMFVFLYLLAAMGVAYWARMDGRSPTVWFAAAVVLTPLGASIALMVWDRYFP